MLKVSTSDIPLITTSSRVPDHEVHVNFPLNHYAGTEGGAVVYFKVPPGKLLATHTDSPEEILYVVAGEAEAWAGDETAPIAAGDLAVIPAMVPHGLRNTGDETLEVVGFFSEAKVFSEFVEPVLPLGQRHLEMQPVPAEAF